MLESVSSGSVRGAFSNGRPYREPQPKWSKLSVWSLRLGVWRVITWRGHESAGRGLRAPESGALRLRPISNVTPECRMSLPRWYISCICSPAVRPPRTHRTDDLELARVPALSVGRNDVDLA
jgi:hypothetical protein